MKSFIVTYDLNSSGKKYDDLISKIKDYSNWAHINESVWFLKSDDICSVIRDNLLTDIDDDYSLFVAELSGSAAWRNTLCRNKFLKEHL